MKLKEQKYCWAYNFYNILLFLNETLDPKKRGWWVIKQSTDSDLTDLMPTLT